MSALLTDPARPRCDSASMRTKDTANVARLDSLEIPHEPEARRGSRRVRAAAALALIGVVGVSALSTDGAVALAAANPIQRRSTAARQSQDDARPRRLSPEARPQLDRTGRTRFGKASFYAPMFAGRKMADGTRMRPTGNNAASRTLPLGTTAKVTNLETGRSAVVTIHDRGPYVAGRIVDLSPATARDIGLDRRTGVTRVEVAPIAIPMPSGHVKL